MVKCVKILVKGDFCILRRMEKSKANELRLQLKFEVRQRYLKLGDREALQTGETPNINKKQDGYDVVE